MASRTNTLISVTSNFTSRPFFSPKNYFAQILTQVIKAWQTNKLCYISDLTSSFQENMRFSCTPSLIIWVFHSPWYLSLWNVPKRVVVGFLALSWTNSVPVPSNHKFITWMTFFCIDIYSAIGSFYLGLKEVNYQVTLRFSMVVMMSQTLVLLLFVSSSLAFS